MPSSVIVHTQIQRKCVQVHLAGRPFECVININLSSGKKKNNNKKFVTSAVTQRTRECDKLVS